MNELIKEVENLVTNGEKQLNQIDDILGGENKPEPPLLDKHIEELEKIILESGMFIHTHKYEDGSEIKEIVPTSKYNEDIKKYFLKVKEDTRKSGYDEGYKKGLEDGEGYQRMSNAIENNKCH